MFPPRSGNPRSRGHRRAPGRRMHQPVASTAKGIVGRHRLQRRATRRSPAPICCSPSGADPIPTTSGSTGPASRSTRAATSRSTTSCAPTCPGSGRSATATAAAPSPTPPTTISRSSPPTCSTASRAASAIASPAYALYIDPPLGRVGMTEREARAGGRTLLAAKRPMTRVGRAIEKGETQGFMKIAGRRRDQRDPRRRDPRHRRRRGDPRHPRHHERRAPYTVLQRAMPIHPTVSELIPTVLGELRPLD